MATTTRTTRKTTPKTTRKAPAKKTTAAKASTGTRSRATASKATAAKVAAAAPKPTVVEVSTPVVAQEDLRKKELIDLVVERSEVKKKFAKPAVEAALAILGETIDSGRELNVPPLGKLRINRQQEKANANVYICKLRRSNTDEPTGEMADDETDE
jgi:DNA-binding protein HU-alpha